jgi:transposase-like protein
MLKQFASLHEMVAAFPDEQSCIDHLRSIRWRDGAFCPHCGSVKVYHFSDNRTHKCGDCRARFSIKVGTIFEDSKIGLHKWFMAIWLITSHKKGIASTQLARDIGVTQKTAWFMLHRLRHAAETKSFNAPLKGQVEADETFIGGKEKNKHANKKTPGSQGGANKAVVFGMLERGGELRAHKAPDASAATVQGAIRENVVPGSSIRHLQSPYRQPFGR